MRRVVVAMSGGVDSSVAAALLKEKGFEVVGITMCFSAVGGSASGGNLPEPKKPSCCGIQGVEDARRVAHKLGIRHYVLNMQGALNDYIIKDFIQEYLKGRTPNPCIRCNQYIKFDVLLKKALSLGAQFLATGHYARVAKNKGNYQLKKAADLAKDQSYFLYRLGQKELKHTLFPLGSYTKKEVRQLARKFGLAVAEKIDSQEICFLPDMDYRGFLKAGSSDKIKPGAIIDTKGKVLGRHQGIAFYTIGQRKGLGISGGEPLYVTGINAKTNTLSVGKKEDVYKDEFTVNGLHFISQPPQKPIASKVRIRYNQKESPAVITLITKNKAAIKFKKAQFAVTPGQAAVFYKKDTVLGGGVIV